MRMVEAFHTCHGRKLFSKYSLKGTPSLIFIAGLGDSSESWDVVQDRISQITSTFSYDRAGVGRSEAAPVPRTCLDLVQELSELLSRIPVKSPYILVGHSFGGLIARLFASRYPTMVSGIVLIDAAHEYKELAYEKILPEKLIPVNRAYLENPMLNREKIDKLRSYKEVVDHSRQSNIPLSIITSGLPDGGDRDDGNDDNDGDDGEWPQQEILQIEQRLQAGFKRLSTVSKIRIAGRSRHYVHHDEPEVVIEEIINMLKGMEL
ncbi:alpha/beta hydrolase [Paenibacillus donghaensis]|uniref:alpha/beta fold hydrolase n=1 Tax=Paenibacillus donghaensis TaxID=414771 RepID=UPI001883A002|nr:alpha/beta hydrolase [Paenibacillus donghaensis]